MVLVLLVSLFGSISTHNLSAAATPVEVKWSRVNIPTEGETGNWVLASGSNVRHLTTAADGTLYCYANPTGTSYTLFKSTDAGYSWTHSGQVKDAIVGIATAPDDADIIYYATGSKVYKSSDAGTTFTQLPPSPGGAGSDNITITDIDVTRVDSQSIIAVATRNSDNAQYGGIYILDENKPFDGWVNTATGNYDAYSVAFSPNYTIDRQLVAVVTDETDTIIKARIGDNAWGSVIGDATIGGLTLVSAAIAFPGDHDATTVDYSLYVAIDTGSDRGDVYRVDGAWAPGNSRATDLDIGDTYNLSNIDVTSLAVSGDATAATLLAGSANSSRVYISTDSGLNWTRSVKKPTGQSTTSLLIAPDFASSGIAYAATSGTESAFSYTRDGGATWNQLGLIDTKISSSGILGLAVSPNYKQDRSLFMLTFDGEHMERSLWRSPNAGAKWERVFTGTLAGDSINLVELSPQYGSTSRVVYLAGTSGSNSAIWKSTDNGQTFRRRGNTSSIDIWKVVDDNTLFWGSYNGSDALVYRSTDGGLSYTSKAVAGNQSLKSIVLSPDYDDDQTILVGNTQGWVYWSKDSGITFRVLGQQLPVSSTGAGQVTVTFDPKFGSNKVVYAASDAKVTTSSTKRLHRFRIGKSDEWESIDSTLPTDSVLKQLAVSASGTLHAVNSQSVDAVNSEGGMQRSLNPTYSLGPTFETVTRGLEAGATLSGLWLRDNQLWSIDTQNTRLMTYIDSLSLPVTPTSPPDKASGTGTGNITLAWETLKGATEYKWQLNYTTNFSTIPTDFEGKTASSSTRSPALTTATTYYWRVRATEPVLSLWSAKYSFTTSLGTAVVAPQLLSPKAGRDEIPVKPLFQWSAMVGATSYELLVSRDAAFSNATIVKIGDYALPSTAWQSDVSLDYYTTYYWKVRASGANTYSVWSAVGVFTTELPPPQAAPSPGLAVPAPSPALTQALSSPAPSPSPAPPPPVSVTLSPPPFQPGLPPWVIYGGIALLAAIVILMVTLLVLVVGIRRS